MNNVLIKLSIAILLVLAHALCNTSAARIDSTSAPKGFILKINPLQLYDGEMRVLMEKKIGKKNALELTGTYFFNYSFFAVYQGEKLFDRRCGFKAGGSYRIYWGEGRFYFAPALFYKYIRYKSGSWYITRGGIIIEGLLKPDENDDYPDSDKHVVAAQLLLGARNYKIKHLMIEWFGGIGGRYVNIIARNNWGEISAKENNIWPSVFAGFNIGIY